ncbi:hypothetical protein K1719_037157 [Acacia pycnantha]|nr:hypothetical protein K1719_037157 [Acacia pycnantha]
MEFGKMLKRVCPPVEKSKQDPAKNGVTNEKLTQVKKRSGRPRKRPRKNSNEVAMEFLAIVKNIGRIAKCVVVTAVRDGMNLIPYEYIACRQGISDSESCFVVSGRGRDSLSKWFTPCEKLGIAAKHGYLLRWSQSAGWGICGKSSDFAWMQIVEPVMKQYTEATDGFSIEKKQEKLQSAFESVEKKCTDIEIEMKNKIEESNETISELRKANSSLEERIAKENSCKKEADAILD